MSKKLHLLDCLNNWEILHIKYFLKSICADHSYNDGIKVLLSGWGVMSVPYPRPRARMCDSSSDGMKTLRNSAEKMPPFFMAPVFLMLSVTERRGWRNWNSLKKVTDTSVTTWLLSIKDLAPNISPLSHLGSRNSYLCLVKVCQILSENV